ncbi:glycogen/starch/alpha-glucan phosphorylase [Acetobacterium wieringae]|uniref:glycogen/starch/alpha-glucan phosphorylase n=1 Tax=Acetobacterium wieringae TaxID=52694 RepID=UPI0026ED8315|nr:glycogen/starch/alpha-glucan phosphorylase [Acetobacterium wieringae]
MKSSQCLEEIAAFKSAYTKKIEEVSGEYLSESSVLDQYQALAEIVMDKIASQWAKTRSQYDEIPHKRVYLFSIEFLIGRLLKSYVNSLDMEDTVKTAMAELGLDYETILNQETDPGLGNGGLGRLMACFLESSSTLGFPFHGNGIHYKHGLFEQKIINGEQVEVADNWLRHGYPFEIRKPNESVVVKFYGNLHSEKVNGVLTFVHENYEPILAVPYDIPLKGYHNNTVNSLRLWSAEPIEEFDLPSFNEGQFLDAVRHKSEAEAITQILYPNDNKFDGKQLRLKQEYFFVCAGLKRMITRFKRYNNNCLDDFAEKICIHINDTHPALCGPEMMRIFMDEEGLSWDDAWKITVNSLTFTNHTVLPEALEKWPVDMMKFLLPRIYMIIEEINRQFQEDLRIKSRLNELQISSLSIIQDGQVNMANLAIICCHSVNGVAALHSKILKEETFNGYYRLFPERFHSVTNGVTPRRFLINSNTGLRDLITESIGSDWINNLYALENLMSFKNDASFFERFNRIKLENKIHLSNHIKSHNHIDVNPESIFDIQVKRIHEYKRQLLNALQILHLYNHLKANPYLEIVPRTFIFAGKAAPGYYFAKEVIKLINAIADLVNNDKAIRDQIKVVFLANFNVSLGEIIYPAANISEQISTAGKEASGTGNMKFMMNGAVTLGTMDGANIEIHEAVGDDNIITFGLSADEVSHYQKNGGYSSVQIYENDDRIQKIMHQLIDGTFGHLASFQSIYDSLLLYNDTYFVLKDFDSYANAQDHINKLYQDKNKWFEMSLCNVAYSGLFSSDRAILEYQKTIWKTL